MDLFLSIMELGLSIMELFLSLRTGIGFIKACGEKMKKLSSK
jgi:hypothetical protein